MPSPEVLQRFIAKVESNAHVEAIETFYAAHASMRENELPPRMGRDALVGHERAVLSRARSVTSECVRPVFVNADYVVIRWVFQFEADDGSKTRIDELAYQRWEGDRIVEEKFYYDPRQLRPQR